MKNIWIQYHPGDCGTFISWFINQHVGFVQGKITLRVNDPVQNEVVCEESTWEWVPDTFECNLNKIDNIGNLHRYAFKTYTEHSSANTDDKLPHEQQHFIDTVKAVPNLATIFCIVPEEHIHLYQQRLSKCFNSYEEGQDAARFYHNRAEGYDIDIAQSKEYFPGVPHYVLNVHALMFEQCDEEYSKLTNWLGVEPNPIWKSIMDFYLYQVFNSSIL